jgi:hypothetical protein
MPNSKAIQLAANLASLALDLRHEAATEIQARGASSDPFECGEARGFAAAMTHSAERLDVLLATYLATVDLVE